MAPRGEGHRVVRPQEEEDFEFTLETDKGRHMNARNKDHLMIPFQYE